MAGEALKLEIPKLPELDKEDVKAIRSFLPGKLLGRTAALLSIVLLVLSPLPSKSVWTNSSAWILAFPPWSY
jgi:hypothetical protein